MAEFMLRGPAQEWFDLVRGSRPAGEEFSWEDFQTSFMTEYQPDSLRHRRAFEFEDLTCTACGSVDAYARRFVQLSAYAPSLVATDAEKARRFIRGLPTPMQRILVGHPDLTYA